MTVLTAIHPHKKALSESSLNVSPAKQASLNTLIIPQAVRESWQQVVNSIAKILNVPAALIMRMHADYIEVFSANSSLRHPYQTGEQEALGQGFYCETVVNENRQLLVPNAAKDEKWCDNPDMKFGLLAYCGLPLRWPNGDMFGTICILDDKENPFTETYQKLLLAFRDSVEAQLKVIYQQSQLSQAVVTLA